MFWVCAVHIFGRIWNRSFLTLLLVCFEWEETRNSSDRKGTNLFNFLCAPRALFRLFSAHTHINQLIWNSSNRCMLSAYITTWIEIRCHFYIYFIEILWDSSSSSIQYHSASIENRLFVISEDIACIVRSVNLSIQILFSFSSKSSHFIFIHQWFRFQIDFSRCCRESENEFERCERGSAVPLNNISKKRSIFASLISTRRLRKRQRI